MKIRAISSGLNWAKSTPSDGDNFKAYPGKMLECSSRDNPNNYSANLII